MCAAARQVVAIARHVATSTAAFRAASWRGRGRLALAGLRIAATWIAILTLVVPAAPVTTMAADVYYDPDTAATGNNGLNGAGLGGAGTWDLSLLNWWSSGSATDAAWNNGGLNTAVFWGTGGTVSLNEAATVGGLKFNSTGYTIGGNTLTLGATNNAVTLNAVAAATITSTLAGTNGFSLSGGVYGGNSAGTLTYQGNSGAGLTGTVNIANGMTLAVSGAAGNLQGVGAINLNGAAGLTLDNSAAAGGNLVDRIGDTTTINVNGNAALKFSHDAAAGVSYAETVGTVNLQSGMLTYTGSQGADASTGTSIFTISNLNRSGTATMNFAGTGLGTDARNWVLINGGVSAGVDLGPWAVVNGTSFAKYDAMVGVAAVGTTTLAAGANGSSTNFLMNGSVTLNASLNPSFKTLQINSTTARTLAIAGNTVSVGGISSNGNGHVISGAGAVQALNAGDPLYFHVNSNSLTVSSVIQNVGAGTTASAVVLSGTNTLVLSGANTYSGGTIINGGTLSVAGDGNLGAAGTGLTFNGSGALTVSSNGAINRTITVNNGAIAGLNISTANGANTFSGPITGSGGLQIASGSTAATFTFSSLNNDFQGVLRIGTSTSAVPTAVFNSLADSATANGAIRLFGNGVFAWGDGATSGLTLNNRVIDMAGTTSGGVVENANTNAANAVRINTDLSVSGVGAKSLTLRGVNTGANTFAGNIANGVGSTIGLIKSGTGTWTLSGNNTYTGNTTVSGGTLNITGTWTGNGTSTTLAYGGTAGTSIVNVSNDMTFYGMTGANVAGAVSVYNQTSGNVTITPGNGNAQYVVREFGYGYFNLTGGTFTNTGRFDVTHGNNTTSTSAGVAYVGGTGVLNNSNADYFMVAYNGNNIVGQLTIGPGGTVTHDNSSNAFAVFWRHANMNGTVNLAGGNLSVVGNDIVLGNSTAANSTGMVNIAGGTVTTQGFNTSSLTGTGNKAYINFAGGTVKSSASNTLMPQNTTQLTTTSTVFGAINNGAVGGPSFSGGATFDTNGFNQTISTPLNGATLSFGVTQANIVLPTTGNSGYIGAPAVTFSTTGLVAGGTPAAGYALISNGQVTGIVITSPGTYQAGATPTITLTGGGGGLTTFTTAALNTNNAAGGLTKIGAGTLTLSAVNTYAGPTVVNGGTLLTGATNLPNTSSLSVGTAGAATFSLAGDGVGAVWNMAAGSGITLGGATAGLTGDLVFQLGSSAAAYDRINAGGGLLTINAGGGRINISSLSGFGVGSYDLISGVSGITGVANLQLGSIDQGGFMYSLDTSTGTKITLNVGAVPSGNVYWTGDLSTSWTSFVLSPANSNWSTTADGATDAGFTPGAANVVNFSAANVAAGPVSTTLDAAVSIQGLNFLSSSASAVTIAPGTGGTLTIGAGGIDARTGAPAALAITAPVVLGTSQTWNMSDAATTLTVGDIVSGATSALTKTGAGAVALNGANTFGGNLTIKAGTVIGGATTAFGAGTITLGDTTTNANAALLGGAAVTFANAVTLAPTTSGVLTIGTSGNFTPTFSGAITGNNNLTIDNSGAAASAITFATGGINHAGTLSFTGTSTGLTTVNSIIGSNVTSINVNTAGIVSISNGGNAFTGDIAIVNGMLNAATAANPLGTTKTIYLGTAATGAGGASLRVANSAVNLSNPIVITGNGNGGTLSLLQGTTAAAVYNGNITANAPFTIMTGTGASTGSITVNGSITSSAGTNNDLTIINTSNSGAGTTSTTIAGAVNMSGAIISAAGANPSTGTTTISGNIGVNVTRVLQSNATSRLLLSGTNTYAGPSIANAGILQFGKVVSLYNGDTAAWNPTNIRAEAGATLAFSYGGTGEFSAAQIDQIMAMSTATGGLKSGALLGLDTSSGSQTYAASLGDLNGGANMLGLNKIGGGTLTLTGTNTYTGPTVVTGGALLFAKAGAFYNGNAAAWTESNFVVNSGTTLAMRVGGTDEFTAAQVEQIIAVGSATGGFRSGSVVGIDTTTVGSLTYDSVIANPNGGANTLGLNKLGTGTLTLTGANTYSGTTTASAGTLRISGTNSTAGNTTVGGGTLQLDNAANGGLASGTLTLSSGTLQAVTADRSLANAVVNSGTTTISGAQSLTLNGTFTNSGGSRTLNSSITGPASLTIAGNVYLSDSTSTARTWTLAGTGNTLISGVIANANGTGQAGNIVYSNTGTTTVTGDNTYTGTTTIAAGNVVVTTIGSTGSATSHLGAGTTALNFGASATTTTGALTYVGAGETTNRAINLASTTTGGGRINSSGTGALNWTGNVTSAGTTKTFTLGGTYEGAVNTFSGNINLVGAGTGHLQKLDAGTWVVSGTLTYANTTVNGGTLRFTGATALGTGTVTLNAGTLDLAGTVDQTVAGDLTFGGGASGAASALTLAAGRKLTLGGNVVYNGANNGGAGTLSGGAGAKLDFGGAARTFNIADSTGTNSELILAAGLTVQNDGGGGLIKQGAGTLRFNGVNAMTGKIEVQEGAVTGNLGSNNLVLNGGVLQMSGVFTQVLGTAANQVQWLGGGFAAEGGALTIAPAGAPSTFVWDATPNFVTAANALVFGSTSADNVVTWGANLDLNNTTGAVTRTISVIDNTATTADRAVLSGVLSTSGAGGTVNLVKAGNGTLELTGANTYVGSTSIDNGTLVIGAANALPTSALRLGNGSTAGTLDLNGFDQTIAGLTVQSNSSTAVNQLVIGAGRTLTINGAVTVGVNVNGSATLLTAGGGGSLVVNSGNGNFQIGGATGSTNANSVTVDFSGLTNFTANLGTGAFRLGDVTSTVNPGLSSIRFAVNNTITAASFRIGDGTGGTLTQVATLGAGTNIVNAGTINIGSAGGAVRAGGTLQFDAADTTGTLKFRAADGTSRVANLNLINTTGNTASTMTATMLLAGHDADIFATSMVLASRAQGTGAANANFSFDQGTLDVTTLLMASRTNGSTTPTGDATATVDLGDGPALDVPTVRIGTITMAVNTSQGGTSTATLNIAGGNVALGTGTGNAINMANAAAGRTAVSNLNLTGGTIVVAGHIVRTGGLGTENATLTLNGASLDMQGNSIGGDAASNKAIDVVLQSGTLRDVGEINNGGVVTKSTSGVLTIQGTNHWTGATNVAAGTLHVVGTLDNTAVSVASGATLSGSGSIAGTAAVAAGGNLAAVQSVGGLTVGGLTLAAGANLNFELSGAFPYALINVTDVNGLTINGGGIRLYQEGTTNAFVTAGTYNLFQFAGAIGGTGSLSVLNADAGRTYTFGTSGNYLTLTISGLGPAAGNYWAPVDGGGGSGTWSSTATVWATAAGVKGEGAQATDATLIFGDTAGTVSVSGSVNVSQGLSFTSTGYAINDGQINFTGSIAANTITVGSGMSAQIGSNLNVSNGLTKAGAGALTLSGANTLSTVVVNGGSLQVASAGSVSSGANLSVVNGATATFSADASLGTVAANGTVNFNGATAAVVTLNGALGGAVNVAANTDLTVSDGTFNGTLAGAATSELIKTSNGTLYLKGSNSGFLGTTTVNGGVLSVATSLGGTVIVNSGGAFTGAGAAGSNVTVNGGGSQTVTGNQSGTTNVSGGTTTVSNSGELSGQTNVSSGTLNVDSGGIVSGAIVQTGGAVNSAGAVTGGVTVDGGLFTALNGGSVSSTGGAGIDVNAGGALILNQGATITGNGTITVGGVMTVDGTFTGGATTVVQTGGTLKGSGTAGAIHVQAGGSLSPGNSVESLSTGGGDLTLDGQSTLTFEFKNATGLTPGQDWDLIDLDGGSLVIDANNIEPNNQIKLLVSSYLPSNAGPGAAANFSAAAAVPGNVTEYDWLFIAADAVNVVDTLPGSIEGRFQVIDNGVAGVFNDGDASNPFQRPISSMGQGTFSVRWVDNQGLYVHYSAIPEPGSMLLCGLGAACAGWYGRRRLKKATTTAEAETKAN